MELTKKDKEYLLKRLNYSESDLPQIEAAIDETDYTHIWPNERETKITARGAIRLLGRETFLGGIARSAFHYTAMRETDKAENDRVYFNSTRFFKS